MPEKKAFERKHFFINRRLQGRYMLTLFVPMVVMLIFMLFTLYFASQSIVSTTTGIIKEDIRDKVAIQLQDKAEPSVGDYEKILDDVDSYLRTFSTNSRYRRALLVSLLWVFGIGVLIVIIQMAVLTIYFSHKVAGPIYRLERVCHGIIDGDYAQKVRLRRGDEMQNLAGLLESVMKKSAERIAALRDAEERAKREELTSELTLGLDERA